MARENPTWGYDRIQDSMTSCWWRLIHPAKVTRSKFQGCRTKFISHPMLSSYEKEQHPVSLMACEAGDLQALVLFRSAEYFDHTPKISIFPVALASHTTFRTRSARRVR